jgi:transposase InsO family protein
MRELAGRHPRYGYRRVAALLRLEGWPVNRKRVYRLWRVEGLKVPKRQRKRRHLGCSDNGVVRRRAERPNHVWTYDFLMDQTSDGRRLKILPVVDEFTRENLALEVERRMGAAGVIEVLTELVGLRGAPEYLRSDNGPEFIAEAIRAWLRDSGVGTLFIEPGAPWENAYIESFNGKLRDELLDREEFGSLLEAKVLAGQWRVEYNDRRPHSGLGYRTPAAFAAAWVPPGLAALGPAEPTREGSEDLTLITVGT